MKEKKKKTHRGGGKGGCSSESGISPKIGKKGLGCVEIKGGRGDEAFKKGFKLWGQYCAPKKLLRNHSVNRGGTLRKGKVKVDRKRDRQKIHRRP